VSASSGRTVAATPAAKASAAVVDMATTDVDDEWTTVTYKKDPRMDCVEGGRGSCPRRGRGRRL